MKVINCNKTYLTKISRFENKEADTFGKITKADGTIIEWQGKEKSSKKGWCKMYKKDYNQLLKSISHSKSTILVWIYLTDLFKQDGSFVFKQKNICKSTELTQGTVSQAIKMLKNEEAIYYNEPTGEWFYNPFIMTVSGQSDNQLAELQNQWEKWIGHYKYEVK